MNPEKKDAIPLYDESKRGSVAPDYSPSETKYRSDRLNELQVSYMIREQTHMELNDMTYSEAYLINRQQDMAYNPPKRNPGDSRIVSGIIHEKDNTILSILMDMNFQPKVKVFDEDNMELIDASTVLTARIKKSLIKDKFNEKQEGMFRTNITQGNVFVEEKRVVKSVTKKVQIGKGEDPSKYKWKTFVEEEDSFCTSVLIPNPAVFLSNLLESDLEKQPYIFIVLHLPVGAVEQVYGKFERWKNVPKFPTRQVPTNVNGIWGDYYLQQPADKYCEVICYQSKVRNEYNVMINGVMMYPVQEEDKIVTGFPLTYFSPSGEYTIVKGDNEPIPFFAYGRSVPSKNQVKEEELNELMRLMIYKMRQASKPPVGNNSDKVLQANIWDPGVITPDIRKEDLSILTENAGITNADFSFYQLISQSIAETSASASVEGNNQEGNITATQYVDQKKENLKKLGLSIDQTIAFLKKIYWLRLYNEIEYVDVKSKQYSAEDDKFIEAYSDFSVEDSVDGQKGKIQVKFVDSNTGRDPYQLMQDEEDASEPMRTYYTRPEYLKNIVKNLKNKIYIDVVAEPEGQNQSLLAILFNLLTQYANLRGGAIPNLNYDYLDKIVGQNSGFESDKLFLKTPPVPSPYGQLGPDGQPLPGPTQSAKPMIPQNQMVRPKKSQNNILSNAK